jgi:hypothetical protein
MTNEKLVKELFKEIYGAMINDKYCGLEAKEVADTAELIIEHFKKQHGIY